jgi:hypothetical protein
MWILTAWQHISPELNEKYFEQCCISSAVDKTDDDMLWNDCEDGDSDTLTGKGKLNLTCFLY